MTTAVRPAAARATFSPFDAEIIAASRRDLQARVTRRDDARYHGGPREWGAPGLIVMHCTAGDRAEPAIGWLNRILKKGEKGKSSYHYVIDTDGRIIRTLDPKLIAYHADPAAWPVPAGGVPKGAGVNRVSIGIAFANDNGSDGDTADDPLTREQLESGLWLCRVLMGLYHIPAHRVIGHRECAPGRKTDPLPRILDMHDWRAALGVACAGGADGR